jgi:hypothetical protein
VYVEHSYGVCGALLWCMLSTFMVYVQRFYSVCAALLWCMLSTFMVYVQRFYGVCGALFNILSRSLVFVYKYINTVDNWKWLKHKINM